MAQPEKVETQPAATGLRAVWEHLKNWAEAYLWVPLALLCIYFFAEFAYFLTGRRPTESVDWIVGLAGNLVKCVFAIVATSIFTQSIFVWLRKEERLSNAGFAIAQMIAQTVALCVFAYLLSH